MKLQLDLENKTITIESDINLGELTETLEKLLPRGEWKEYTLQPSTEIVQTNPIVPKDYYPHNPYRQWWEQPPITCVYSTGTTEYQNTKT